MATSFLAELSEPRRCENPAATRDLGRAAFATTGTASQRFPAAPCMGGPKFPIDARVEPRSWAAWASGRLALVSNSSIPQAVARLQLAINGLLKWICRAAESRHISKQPDRQFLQRGPSGPRSGRSCRSATHRPRLTASTASKGPARWSKFPGGSRAGSSPRELNSAVVIVGEYRPSRRLHLQAQGAIVDVPSCQKGLVAACRRSRNPIDAGPASPRPTPPWSRSSARHHSAQSVKRADAYRAQGPRSLGCRRTRSAS